MEEAKYSQWPFPPAGRPSAGTVARVRVPPRIRPVSILRRLPAQVRDVEAVSLRVQALVVEPRGPAREGHVLHELERQRRGFLGYTRLKNRAYRPTVSKPSLS